MRKKRQPDCALKGFCLTRRQFLQGAGATAATVVLSSLPGVLHAKEKAALRVVGYPKKRLGRLSELRQDEPVEFSYPHEHPNCQCILVKLGQEAAGGIGPQKDIVAFSALCTHMGTPMPKLYKPQHKALGPCSAHLSVFDLRRHGMVVSGHGTESLPQVILELEGDEIYATGVAGLIFGFSDNRVV
ncbi:MAG: arsenate reductase (azurin) small subunit [Chloroflexota bacterium]